MQGSKALASLAVRRCAETETAERPAQTRQERERERERWLRALRSGGGGEAAAAAVRRHGGGGAALHEKGATVMVTANWPNLIARISHRIHVLDIAPRRQQWPSHLDWCSVHTGAMNMSSEMDFLMQLLRL